MVIALTLQIFGDSETETMSFSSIGAQSRTILTVALSPPWQGGTPRTEASRIQHAEIELSLHVAGHSTNFGFAAMEAGFTEQKSQHLTL